MAEQVMTIGIDLGTTNSALAFTGSGGAARPFDVLQVTRPGLVQAEPLLPSCLYLHAGADFAEGALALPWDPDPGYVVGALAKQRGTEAPLRFVASAKSWLSHTGVDRTAAVLPPDAPASVGKVSPVEASRRYLEHLRRAWEHAHPDAPFASQQVLVTVPASFDAVARDLTARAAEQAGIANAILLEEPQAAFYAWIERHPDWRDRVRPGDAILVADTGGGTTDFSLIQVRDEGGDLALERVAVGEHILLGGDNMDLALAYHVERELASKGKRIDSSQRNSLLLTCRAAKEKLLAPGSADQEYPVSVLGRGSGLIGAMHRHILRREDVERLIVEGFFPLVESGAEPVRAAQSGLMELGLPYAADTAVTRHLARFLRQGGKSARPAHVLFNGGVFHAPALRERVLQSLENWLGQRPAELPGEDLTHAVARGAAYYGLARQGKGIRIRGGISRTYYIGVKSSMPAVPGMKPPVKALAVARFGMEEGTSVRPTEREFGLLVGEPVEFRFFGSVTRKDDEPGTIIEDPGEDIEELAPVEVTLPASAPDVRVVPVTLETEVTETGQLRLWCAGRDGGRWKLEYNLREQKP